ncbi:MAG: PHP domain-containing protein [Eubacteriaceae bacterium]|nr:PHP domain-containing protein [Eubacteriaceae bacterium]
MFTVEEAVFEAVSKGVGVFSITDHDSIKSVSAAMEIARSHNMLCVPAIEATSVYMGLEIHILGYGINLASYELLEFINNTAILRYSREIEIIKAAMKAYDGLSLLEFHEFTKQDISGGFASLNYLVDKGKVEDLKSFQEAKKSFMPNDADVFAHASKVIKILKDANAITVLAHPSYHFPGNVMDIKTLDSFADLGIDGVECYSPYNDTQEQISYYKAFCEKRNLAISAGSDSHGPYLSRSVGYPYADTNNTSIIDVLQGRGLGISQFRSQKESDRYFP